MFYRLAHMIGFSKKKLYEALKCRPQIINLIPIRKKESPAE
jgi:hypothetical protein